MSADRLLLGIFYVLRLLVGGGNDDVDDYTHQEYDYCYYY